MLKEIFSGKCPVCSGASALNEPVCSNCREHLKPYIHFCGKCGFPLTKPGISCYRCSGKISKRITNIYALYHYNKYARSIILQMKFHYNIRLNYTLKHLINLPNFVTKYDGIEIVPSHLFRRMFRFYHPADVIGKYVAYKLNVPVLHHLKRVRYTVFQSHISKSERVENVKDAFQCKKYNENIKNILLIDDVFTTGATINQCVKALYSAGARRIDVLVFAK